MKLNNEQKEAIDTKDGFVLVLAGAGTGKTTTMTERIFNLVQKGVKPENILAVTFTNRAATDMKLKLSKKLKNEIDQITMTTFHSFCARILREEAEMAGYRPGFYIISQNEQKNMIKKHLKEINSKVLFADAFEVIKEAKTNNVNEKKLARERGKDEISDIYAAYMENLKKANCMDFDDLINNTLNLFKKNKKILTKYQNKYLYVHVDEYQDTSTVQNELIEKLVEKNGNLFVVGDDDQSIYS